MACATPGNGSAPADHALAGSLLVRRSSSSSASAMAGLPSYDKLDSASPRLPAARLRSHGESVARARAHASPAFRPCSLRPRGRPVLILDRRFRQLDAAAGTAWPTPVSRSRACPGHRGRPGRFPRPPSTGAPLQSRAWRPWPRWGIPSGPYARASPGWPEGAGESPRDAWAMESAPGNPAAPAESSPGCRNERLDSSGTPSLSWSARPMTPRPPALDLPPSAACCRRRAGEGPRRRQCSGPLAGHRGPPSSPSPKPESFDSGELYRPSRLRPAWADPGPPKSPQLRKAPGGIELATHALRHSAGRAAPPRARKTARPAAIR